MSTNVLALLPELILTLTGVLVMLAEPCLKLASSRKPLGWIAIAGTVASLLASWYQVSLGTLHAFSNTIQVDAFSVLFHYVIGAVVLVTLLGSLDYFEGNASHAGEYFALLCFGAVGMMLMTCSVELLMVFVGLEISSITTYILCGFRKGQATGSESSIKYFLLGSFATAFFLYGIAFAFGAIGSTDISALALILIGLGFKVSAAPFHVWTPDVYQGAPAPVVGLMSTAPKAAVFAVLLRILFAAAYVDAFRSAWFWLVWVSAVLSMSLGNIGALVQNNVKRMLAYSSIAHAGYMLVAFAARSDFGIAAAIFYTASYAAMNVGAFAVVSHLAGSGESRVSIDDYAGLSKRSPLLAFTLTIFMLSLIGIPLTGGFYAKYYVFNAALQSNFVWLTIIGLVNSAVAAYYYLRVIVVMYMRDPIDDTPLPAPSTPMKLALVLAAIFTLYLGIFPGRVVRLAERGAADLTEKPTNAAAKPAAAVSASAATPGR